MDKKNTHEKKDFSTRILHCYNTVKCIITHSFVRILCGSALPFNTTVNVHNFLEQTS